MTPEADYQPYIVRPLVGMSEGEIDLDKAGGEAEAAVMEFMRQLFLTALQDESGHSREDSAISSHSIQRQAGKLRGRIYGQAYTEKKGETVIFLRAKLFDDEGQLVMTGMTTSHIPRAGGTPVAKPEN